MSENTSPLVFSIAWTIRDIPRRAWDELFGDDIIEGFGYQKTLEESGTKEFVFRYLLGRRDNTIVAIIPFFIMDFSFDILMPEAIRRAVIGLQKRFRRFLRMKVLFLGSPTAEEFYFGMSKHEDLSAVLDSALRELRVFSKENGINATAFHNLSLKNQALMAYLEKRGFIKMETLPTTSITINATSLENYISSLSKNTRKDLKRKLKKSSQLRITTEVREDIADILDQVYRLYLNNFNSSDVHFETLTPEFFRNICRNMPGVAKYFITFYQDKAVAFNLCLVKNDTCIDKFIGFDQELAYRYHLYFITFCHNIDWCIKNGVHFYQLGVSDYYPKVRLGAKLVPLYIYAYALNPVLRLLIKSTVRLIEPKNIDSSLKDLSPS